MYWYEVYELLQCNGAIRRSCWEEGKWIELKGKELVDQDGEFYDICDFELRAMDWEEVVPARINVELLSDKQFLSYVKTKSLSIIQHKAKTLNLKLRSFAEKQGAIPMWGNDTGKKYYIAHSHIGNKYIVESSWNQYHLGLTYFSNKEVAQKCITIYKSLMDELRHLEGVRGILFNSQDLTREEVAKYNSLLDSL